MISDLALHLTRFIHKACGIWSCEHTQITKSLFHYSPSILQEQSNDLATFLANPPSPLLVPELIFSSPFYRCIQTAAPLSKRLGLDIKLEHGVQEWYSNVIPDTGLHPRPGHAQDLQQFFPEIELNKEWKSTVYASRRGEDLKALLARAEVVRWIVITLVVSSCD